jgi:hypothetical protein
VFRRLPAGLWIVLSLALLLRLGWGLTRASSDAAIDALPDQREYLSIARNILAGHGAQFFDQRFGQTVYAYRMPGYPWLVAACGCNPRIVRGVQALLDTSTVLAVFLLGTIFCGGRHKTDRCPFPSPGTPGEGQGGGLVAGSGSELSCHLQTWQPPPQPSPGVPGEGERSGVTTTNRMSHTDARPALVAALLVAINPYLIYFSGLILSETLFIAMLAWGMLLLLSPVCRKMFWISGAAVLAMSIYVRPSALLLPVILAFGSARAAAERVNRALLAGVLTVAVLVPWGWRNSQPSVLGHWVWTTTNEGITAYDGWNPTASGGSNQAFLRNMPELTGMGEIQRSHYLAARAGEFVMSHPLRAVDLAMVKLGRLWSPMPLSEQYSSSAYRAVGLLYCVPFDLLVLAGLIRGKLTRAAKVFLLLPAIYLTVVHMASVGSLRYLLPAIGPMGVLAGSLFSRPRPGRMG